MAKVMITTVLQRLEEAESCWIATTDSAGAPHTVPVWAVWHEGAAWIYSAQNTRHVKHVRLNPRLVLHLPETHEVVLVEATATIVETKAMIEALAPTFKSRYAMDLEGEMERHATCFIRVQPHTIRTWGSGGNARWNLVEGEWLAVQKYAPF